MPETLPFRAARAVSRRFATPLVQPDGGQVEPGEDPRIYLAPAMTGADERILGASLEAAGLRAPRWLASRRGRVPERALREAFLSGQPVLAPLAPARRGPDRLARLLSWAQQAGRSVELVPVETLWGPADRPPSLRRLPFGNPYDPPSWFRWLRPRRDVRVILGRPGTVAELAAQAPQPDDAVALASFVRGQAVKALSQTERRVLGERYKVPRLLVEQILGEPEFRDRVAAAGATRGLTRSESRDQAERALRELATTHDFLYMEIFRRFCHWLHTKVYEPEIVADPGELEQLRELARSSALVFIPSHKSNFDHLTLYNLLFSSGFPPPHTAAGNNMSFFPMSRILPRTGAYFIRRSFQDDPVYKEALAGFVNYLVQRRFHQEFFIEGGRTRSGKQLPPRFGMLRYVVDGCRRSQVHDVHFVPTSITYDQLLEVDEYARELGGQEKERESFGFLVRMIRSLRGRDFGRVYVRFGEPIALREHLERTGDDRLTVEKLAFQIANQINAHTTLTPVSLACAAFTGAAPRALTLPELEHDVQRMLDYAEQLGLALGHELHEGAKATVEAAIHALRGSRVVDLYDGGLETVYSISRDKHLVASFYRNTIIHFFLTRAIATLARAAAAESGDMMLWSLRLRALLKFEFFFSERDEFRAEIERELAGLADEEARGLAPIRAAGPGILLDYLESGWVVTESLRSLPPGNTRIEERELLQRCHALGRQKLLQGDVHAPELLSNLNFRNALLLAVNQGAARADGRRYLRGDAEALAALSGDLEKLARLARLARAGAR